MSYLVERPYVDLLRWCIRLWSWVKSKTVVRSRTASGTLDEEEYHARVNATSGAITITVPPAATRDGREILITKIDSSANAVTIARSGSDTFNGATSVTLSNQWDRAKLISNGNANWDIEFSGKPSPSGDVTGPASSTDNAVARFDGTGGKTIQNSSFIVDDSGHVTSFGGNLTFPATQASSAGANTLDDYEEGTWTPTLAGSTTAGTQTYSVQIGRYVKIGRMVHAIFSITLTAKDGTTAGDAQINGAPFTAENVTNFVQTGAVGYWQNFDLTAGYSYLGILALMNSTTTILRQSGDNNAVIVIDQSAFSSTAAMNGQSIYRATT